MNGTPLAFAHVSSRPTVESPMPRFGTFRMRFRLTSSTGFATAFRYASASLISRRS